MKKTIFTFAFLLMCLIASAQVNTTPKYNIPEEYSFVLPEDYDKYQPQIKEAIDWYLWRSMGLDEEKRKNAAAFFSTWLVGSPTVTIVIDDKIVDFLQTNPQLLLPFCMGGAKYAIDNNSNDRVKLSVAGIEAVVAYYNKNRAFMNKQDSIEKYEKMIKKKKLENYIRKKLN